MDTDMTYLLVSEEQYHSVQGFLAIALLASEFNLVAPHDEEYLQEQNRFLSQFDKKDVSRLIEHFNRTVREGCVECYVMPDSADGKISAEEGRQLREFFERGVAAYTITYDSNTDIIKTERLKKYPERMVRWTDSC